VGTVITRPESPSGATEPPAAVRPRGKCQGAMSQQGYGAHGNESYPQKLLQLVGHRDPDAHLDAWGPRLKQAGGGN
jgi:hypothetical protein